MRLRFKKYSDIKINEALAIGKDVKKRAFLTKVLCPPNLLSRYSKISTFKDSNCCLPVLLGIKVIIMKVSVLQAIVLRHRMNKSESESEMVSS